jgi:SPP1 gp7 family putative phage head morphogenesis protein
VHIGRVVKDPDAFRRAGKTVFKTAQRRATLIARTETLRAHNEGRKVFYRQVGVTRVRWLTAHDERTCPICRPLDGKVFGIEEVQSPPSHASCRCTTIAVLSNRAT